MRNLIFGALSLLLTVFAPLAHAAEEKIESRPFVIVTTTDGTTNEFLISDNLKLVPDTGELFITEDGGNLLGSHIIDDIAALGIAYHDVVVTGILEHSVDSFASGWSIYNIEGTLVAAGNSGAPDYSRLEKNRSYIINDSGKTFKYIRLK